VIDAGTRGTAPPADASADEASWLTLGSTLVADLAGALRERLHLLALESQQSVHSAGRLLALGVIAAVLLLAAWFVSIAALVALLVFTGVPLAAALLAGAGLNIAGAWMAWGAMRRQLAAMGFPATLRAMHIARPARTPASAAAFERVGPVAHAGADDTRASSRGEDRNAQRALDPTLP
jgi:uncharacterized membrane protein YqjE